MNKKTFILFFALLQLYNQRLHNNKTVDPKDALVNLDALGDNDTKVNDLPDWEDTEIANAEQTSCSGDCIDISMDLTGNGSWVSAEPVGRWTSSHGTPSVGPNILWMWSYNGGGEGVNMQYTFTKGERYCM